MLRCVLFACLLALAGCAGQPDDGLLVPNTAVATGARPVDMLVATTRERAADANTLFNGERAADLDFAHVSISIPPKHVPGAIEWPRTPPGDPARDFVTRDRGYLDGEAAFAGRLKAALATRPPEDRTVLVFVHGYNTAFAEGIHRLAQVTHDTGFPGVPVLFTWASRGNVLDYVYDRDSATVARDGLERTLRIAADSGARNVVLFAHSMGNWVTVEALRQAKIAGEDGFGGKVTDVILASPDIDVDVFKAQMRRYGKPEKPFLMLISSDDRALRVSSFIAGDKPRIGAYTEDVKEIADLGVVVLDLSAVQGEGLNHDKYNALAPGFVGRVLARIRAGDALDVPTDGIGESFGAIGSGIGGFVGGAASVVITTPLRIITAPVDLITRSR